MLRHPPFEVHRTEARHVEIHSSGWIYLDEVDAEVTAIPCVDLSGESFLARPDYRTSLEVEAREEASMLSTGLVDLITRVGFYCPPTIVRETPEETAERLKRGGQNPLERMATVEWARRHDQAFLRYLEGWSGRTPVCNGGKDWIRGAKPGRALNYGWDRAPDPRAIDMWQSLGTRHDASHTDYSQTLRLVRPARKSSSVGDVVARILALRPTLEEIVQRLGVQV